MSQNKRIQHKYEYLHQPINVVATYIQGRPSVLSFEWESHSHKVREVCLVSKARRGSIPVWLFSVSTDDGSYKLRMDTDTLNWWLEEVYTQST